MATTPSQATRQPQTEAGSAEGATAESGTTTREAGKPAESGGSERSSGTSAERHTEIHKEAKLFGINPEAVGLVIAVVLASVLLALMVWLRPVALVYIAAVGFGLVFAGFDVREVLHQIDESRAALIAIASLLVGLHLLVAILAGSALLSGRAGTVRAHDQTA